MTQYLLIDGNNTMFASQMARTRLTAGEIETTAIFGMISSLRWLATKFPGARQVVLWDSSPTWRHHEYPEYKGKRDQNPQIVAAKEALKAQRPRCQELLPMLDVDQFTAKGYEADDLAGYFCRKLSAAGASITCVTNDQDWLQLVGPRVSWFDPREGSNRLVTDMNFEEETGYCNPVAFLIAKALQGDTSDNLPGVGGLGEGAAKAILERFNSIGELLVEWPDVVDTIPKKTALSRFKKKISDFVAEGSEGMTIYERNWRFMNLMAVDVPTVRLDRKGRDLNLAGFADAIRKYGFLSILNDFARWSEPFTPLPKAA